MIDLLPRPLEGVGDRPAGLEVVKEALALQLGVDARGDDLIDDALSLVEGY